MKFIIGTIATIITGLIVQSFLPWWTLVVAAAFVGLWVKLNGIQSFIYGFIGAGLLWGIYAFMLNSGNDGILANRMGNLLGGMGGFTLIVLSAIVSGLMGGLGAMTGSLGRQLFEK